jgi:hypothetical protein
MLGDELKVGGASLDMSRTTTKTQGGKQNTNNRNNA